MKLTEEVKQNIISILDSKEFMSDLYEGLSAEQRKKLGMVYTPAKVCIQLIEMLECDTLAGRNILDPACGSGNLLIACLIAGADSDKLYGNELDPIAVSLCRRRLDRACRLLNKPSIRSWQVHEGDATEPRCLSEFSPDYQYKTYEPGDLFSLFF